MSKTVYLVPAGIALVCLMLMFSPVTAYHIKTVQEGLLDEQGCYIGAYLGGSTMAPGPDDTYESWIRDPSAFNKASGKTHTLFSRYISLQNVLTTNENRDGKTTSEWAGGIITGYDAVPVIFLVPWDSELNLSHVYPDGRTAQQHIDDFAAALKPLTKDGKNTIIIVFGHEMESQQVAHDHPDKFISMFQYAADTFHAAGCQVAWCTNVNNDPFATPDPQIQWWPGSENPYHTNPKPGNAYVDWVAQTRYHFYWNANTFEGLKGEYLPDTSHAWYNYFGTKLHFPLMFAETAGQKPAPYTKSQYWDPDPLNKPTQDFSTEWIPALYNAQKMKITYPLIKAVIWFDTDKFNDNGHPEQNYLIPPGVWTTGDPGSVQPLSGDLYKKSIGNSYFIGSTASVGSQVKPGTIQVSSVPKGAYVSVDGIPVNGITPLTATGISIGPHRVVVTKNGYREWQGNVTVRTGIPGFVNAVLQPVNGSISVQCIPPGGEAIIDGTARGTTPLTVPDIPAGVHQLVVRKPGYGDWKTQVSVTGGVTSFVMGTMQPTSGSVQVNSVPAGGKVYLDRNLTGTSPVLLTQVTPGGHTIIIQKDGYTNFTGTVTVNAGFTSYVSAVLVKIPKPKFVYTENDNTRTFNLSRNDIVAVTLNQNSASTGYRWEVTSSPGISLLDHSFKSSGSGAPGAGGTETWVLKMTGTGIQEFSGVYRQSWRPLTGEERHYTINFRVT